MLNSRLFAIVLLVPFSLLTLYALTQVGYLGILDYHRHSSAGWQVMADLVIALLLVLAWLVPHAREHGRNPWPWVVVTLTMGSLGPLLYLVLAPKLQSLDNVASAQ
jgi:hypothetical protein